MEGICVSKLRFSKVKKNHLQISFLGAPTRVILSNFKIFCCTSFGAKVLEQKIVWPCYYFNFKSPCFLLNKNETLIKTKPNRKWKTPDILLERRTLWFGSYKNHELKVKLWWFGARERVKVHVFVAFILSKGIFFLTIAFYLNVSCIE